MLNEFQRAVSARVFTVRAATLAIVIVGLGELGFDVFPGPSTLSSVRADEPTKPAADPPKPREPTAEEQQALAEFHKLYRLEKDQIVKYIKPPFVAGRLIDREYRWKDKWMNGDYQPPRPGRAGLMPHCYIYFERDGELAPPHHFSSGSDQRAPAENGVDLVSLIGMITDVREGNLINPDKLPKQIVAGDWIVRAGAPPDQVVAALRQILNRECGVPIKLEMKEESEDVVVVRTGDKPQFVPKLDSPIKLYVNKFQPDQGKREQGTFPEFLKALGEFIEPNRRVVSEDENAPKVMMSWHRNVPDLFDDGDVESVLEHLDQQTGLKFTLETLKTRKVIVERMVAPAVGVANAPADVEKLLAEFRKIYHLDEGQVIKRIKPPYPAGRMYDLDRRAPEFKVLTGEIYKEANLCCLIYRERGGKHENKWPFFAYTNDGASKGYEAGSLAAVIGDVKYRDIEDPDRLLLDKPAFGDFVVNADTPTDKVIAAFGEILSRECGLPVKLEFREGEEPIVVVQGRVKPEFVPKVDAPIKLYTNTFRPDRGKREQGTFPDFLKALGEFIEPNRPVVSEVENPPQGKMFWQCNVPDLFDDGDVESALDHLDQQTGLKFTLASRKTRRIIVTRNE